VNAFRRHVPESLLYGMQDRQQGTLGARMGLEDGCQYVLVHAENSVQAR